MKSRLQTRIVRVGGVLLHLSSQSCSVPGLVQAHRVALLMHLGIVTD